MLQLSADFRLKWKGDNNLIWLFYLQTMLTNSGVFESKENVKNTRGLI